MSDDFKKLAGADAADKVSPAQQSDGSNLASFLQNLTPNDYKEALLAQNVADNSSRGLGANEQAYCDGNYAGQHLVVRFTPGFDPRDHKNEPNAQRTVYLEPPPGQPQGYYNCLTNCHYDKNGNLVGTPAHAEQDPYTGKITVYIPPNTPEVHLKNHFPDDKKKQQRSVNT